MHKIYTIGYEKSAQTALMATLLDYDIEALLDIRELPQSRRPGFSKTALSAAAREHGISYTHIRALGTPRDIRYQRKIDHDQRAFEKGFLEYLATQDEAMNDLTLRAQRERCCLLCYEADPRECHRWFVAERAVELSHGALGVVHLTVASPV